MSGISQLVLSAGAPPQGAVVLETPFNFTVTALFPSSTYGIRINFNLDGTITYAGLNATINIGTSPTRWWSLAPVAPAGAFYVYYQPTSAIQSEGTIGNGVWTQINASSYLGFTYNAAGPATASGTVYLSATQAFDLSRPLSGSFSNPN